VPTLSKVRGTRQPGFDGKKMVKTMSFRPAAANHLSRDVSFNWSDSCP